MIRPGIRRLFHLRPRDEAELERELDEEIRWHIEQRAKLLEAQGLSREAAWAEARRRFGPAPTSRRALLREARRRETRVGLRQWLEALGQDLRYGWRSLRREPGLAAVVVVVIGLGVGANAAMFGVLDRLLLRGPEHVVDASRVRRIYFTAQVPGRGEFTANTLGYVAYTTLRDRTRSFSGVAAYSETDATLGRGEDARRIRIGHATADFFPLLGVRPALGRFFDGAEDRPGAAQRVVVLGYGLWRDRFGGDRAILGRAVAVNGETYEVVGVAPAGFTGVELERVDAWAPMSLRGSTVSAEWQTTWDAQWLKVVGRLAPGTSPEAAGADATRAFRNAYAGDEAPLAQARITPAPLWFDDDGHEAMEVAVSRWLIGVSLVVLLVACANVANLLLARSFRQRREVAVRLALGVPRARLVRLLLAQSLVLALLGGAAALLLAPLVVHMVRTTLLSDVEWVGGAVNARVLAFAGGLTLLTGLATGLLPALQAGRGRLAESLRTGVREGGGRSSRLRSWLGVAQAAFSVVLLVGAGLFVRSVRKARALDLGIEPERVVLASASWPRDPRFDGPDGFEARRRRTDAFYDRALERVRRMRGVEQAAVAIGTPFRSSFQKRLSVAGWDSIPRLPGGGPYIQAVSPGYFATTGLRLLRGRAFGASDHEGTEPVTIVNRTMARTLWPSADAIGQCLRIGADPDPPCARVIGIVEDAHRFSLREEPAMQYYIPLGQERGMGGSVLLVRAAGPPATLVEPLRRALRAVDPGVLWVDVQPMEESLAPQIRPWRLGATLIGVFGGLALLIAGIGLYSLVAYMVANRAHELGVRLALGARPGDVVRMVVRHGLLLAGSGLAVGVVLAVVAAGSIRDLLFQTSPEDPLIYGGVVGVLLLTATLASLVPARRATRLDPVRTLRAE